MLSVVTALGLVLRRSITRPLSEVWQGARTLSSGDLAFDVSYAGRDEIGDVAAAFRDLHVTAERLVGEIRATNAAISDNRLDHRADVGAFEGTWAQLLAGMNDTTAAFARLHQDLAASRARIVAASDQARRRIEHDLHDGAQQRLVSLGLGLRAAQKAVPPGQPGLRQELARLARGTAEILEELRELSRGIHPAILSLGGLGPALKALARRSPVPVKLDVRVQARLPERAEVAAYFVVSEALANVAKHARASVVEVQVEVRDGALAVSISDDGIGGADPSRGSGLIGLTDRVEASGGTISISSHAGAGTRITAELPVDASQRAGVTAPRRPGLALEPGQQGGAVGAAESRAGVPAGARRVGAVVPAGDVAEAGHRGARRHPGVQERLDQAELLAGRLRQPADQRRPQRGDRAGAADDLGLAAGVDLVAGGRVGVARHVRHAPPARARAGAANRPPGPAPRRPPARTAGRTCR